MNTKTAEEMIEEIEKNLQLLDPETLMSQVAKIRKRIHQSDKREKSLNTQRLFDRCSVVLFTAEANRRSNWQKAKQYLKDLTLDPTRGKELMPKIRQAMDAAKASFTEKTEFFRRCENCIFGHLIH